MTDPGPEYMHIREARQLLGVSTQTLHNWDKKGQIRTTRLPGGTRLYHKQDIYNILGIDSNANHKQKIIYCRIPFEHESDKLDQQIDILRTQYPDHALVTDIGSSTEWKRKGVRTIIDRTLSGNLEEVVVLHSDQLGRFTFEMLEYIFSKTGTRLVVMENDAGKATEQELAEDILSLVHQYSCKKSIKRLINKRISKTSCDSDSESI